MTCQKVLALPTIALSLALSTSCSAKPSQNTQASVQSSLKTKPQQAQLSKTSYRPQYLKPGASISYSHKLPADIKPGESFIFQLTLNEGYETGNMVVDIRPEGDVQIFPSSSRASFDMTTGSSHVMDISVTVGSLGQHYLNVQAMAYPRQGQPMPRIFSIPVLSGPTKARQPHSKMTRTPNGENIIIMEAVEVIR